jgi:hypothetical protein
VTIEVLSRGNLCWFQCRPFLDRIRAFCAAEVRGRAVRAYRGGEGVEEQNRGRRAKSSWAWQVST